MEQTLTLNREWHDKCTYLGTRMEGIFEMSRVNQRIRTIVLHKIFSLICSAHDDAGSSCSRQQGKQAVLLRSCVLAMDTSLQ